MNSKHKNPMLRLCLTVMFTVLVLAAAASVKAAKNDLKPRNYYDFGSDWLDENGEQVQLEKLTEGCTIRKQIPLLTMDAVLSFNARNIDVDVYIDDMCIFDHRSRETGDTFLKAFYGKTMGSAFVELPVPREQSGRSLYIKVSNPYSNGSACKIVNMYFGDGVSIVKHDASVNLGAFCFGVIILFIGAVCLVIYIPMGWRHKMIDSSMLYLGMAAFAFGIMMITDSKMLHLIVGHETLYYTVSQLFMVICPIPLLLFFEKLYGNLNKKIIYTLCILDAADFAAVLILGAFGVMDYHDNAFPVLMLYAVSVVYIGAVTVQRMIKHDNENIFHNIGVIMMALSAVLDILMTKIDGFSDNSFFMWFGIAGFTCMECTQVLWKHIENYRKAAKAQLVSRLAYHDGLTDMLNRTSFMEDMEKLEEEASSDVLIAMFDVNNLKYVNDTFGHSDGDDLIIGVADCLRKAFGSIGKCYRIGGDEFVFIAVCQAPEEKFAEAKKMMDIYISDAKKRAEYPVSVAAGYSVKNGRECTVKELLDEADEKMYENKREMKTRETLIKKSV